MMITGGKNMLNNAVIVGRIVQQPELKETEKGGKFANITLAVPRSFKNSSGEYETDFINCTLWQGIAESTVEYVKKGDLIGIKARIQSRNIVDETDQRKTIIEIIADKVTFLSSKPKE